MAFEFFGFGKKEKEVKLPPKEELERRAAENTGGEPANFEIDGEPANLDEVLQNPPDFESTGTYAKPTQERSETNDADAKLDMPVVSYDVERVEMEGGAAADDDKEVWGEESLTADDRKVRSKEDRSAA